jgi:Co/Zn/Cd efflux system component
MRLRMMALAFSCEVSFGVSPGSLAVLAVFIHLSNDEPIGCAILVFLE